MASLGRAERANGIRSAVLRSTWNRRSASWSHHVFDSPLFEQVRSAVVEATRAAAGERVVDLGAGSGFLTLELAPRVSEVIAVDLSDSMLAALEVQAHERGIDNIAPRVADLRAFDLPPASVEVIVSNYALHHLTDADKAALLRRALHWLRPGGRLVVADMMFGRGLTPQDRTIIRAKVTALLAKGPGGWWRVGKNLVRFGLRRGTELPATPDFWVRTAQAAGFVCVHYRPIVAEAGLLTAEAPARSRKEPG